MRLSALFVCFGVRVFSCLNVNALSIQSPNEAPSRRTFMSSVTRSIISGSVGTLTYFSSSSPAFSVDSSLEKDKAKIVAGYKRLNYLLDNWEKLTTVCGNNDNPYLGCDRSPEKVMEYLGFKSMDDPLFRADKTLIRLQSLVSDKDAGVFQDAIDTWLEKSEEGNGLAFISSWGEANPGGGKDRVALFIERSKKDVIESRDVLATVIKVLDLKVD